MIRVAVDAMGGDRGPAVVIEGALRSASDELVPVVFGSSDLDTRGLARVFVALTSHSQVSGRLANEAAHPETYRADVRRNGDERHYAVDFLLECLL